MVGTTQPLLLMVQIFVFLRFYTSVRLSTWLEKMVAFILAN